MTDPLVRRIAVAICEGDPQHPGPLAILATNEGEMRGWQTKIPLAEQILTIIGEATRPESRLAPVRASHQLDPAATQLPANRSE